MTTKPQALIALIITWPITYIGGRLLLNCSLFANSKKAKAAPAVH
jgi:amino acid permease